jgi:hypothetical protein
MTHIIKNDTKHSTATLAPANKGETGEWRLLLWSTTTFLLYRTEVLQYNQRMFEVRPRSDETKKKILIEKEAHHHYKRATISW